MGTAIQKTKLPSIPMFAISIVAGIAIGWLARGGNQATTSTSLTPGLATIEAPREPTDGATLEGVLRTAPRVASDTQKADSGTDAGAHSSVRESLVKFEDSILGNLVFSDSDVDYLAKYEGLSPDQLTAARCILDSHHAEMRGDISKELLASGRCDRTVVTDGQPYELHSPPPTSDGKPVSWGFTEEPADGFKVIKSTVIDANEFPEFRALELEAFWVHQHLHKLGHCRCNKPSTVKHG